MNPVRTTFLLLLTCLPALAGCLGPTQFTSALTDPGETRYDPRLVGTWYARAGEPRDGDIDYAKGVIVAISPRRDGQLAISYRSERENLRLSGHASSLDGEVYYNVRPDLPSYFRAYPDASEAPHFLLFRVQFVNDDKLFVWTSFLPDGMEKLVQKARHVSLGVGGFTVIDQSREELLATIRGISPQKLFAHQLGPFFRIPEPAERFQSTHWLRDDKSGCAVASFLGLGDALFKSVSWSGECTEGKASGRGILVLDHLGGQGFRFEGTMVEGRPHGSAQCRLRKSAEWKSCRFDHGAVLKLE